MALPSSERRTGLVRVVVVVVVVAVQGCMRTRAARRGRAKQRRRRGVSRQRARRLTDGVTYSFSGQPWIKLFCCLPGCMKSSRTPGFLPEAASEAKHPLSRDHGSLTPAPFNSTTTSLSRPSQTKPQWLAREWVTRLTLKRITLRDMRMNEPIRDSSGTGTESFPINDST